jgi:hypothetical protein
MFKSNWLHRFAFRGCLIASLIAPWPIAAQGNDPTPEKPSAETSAQQQPDITIDPSVLRGIFHHPMQIDSHYKNTADDDGKRKEAREEADLVAQEDMAKWALGMLIATVFGICINIATLVFLKKTFEANKKTADAAVDSASATVAAERARFFVEIVSLDTHANLRESSINDPDQGKATNGQITACFKFTNLGKTPGVIFEIHAGIMISKDPPDHPVYTNKMLNQIGRAYGGGDETLNIFHTVKDAIKTPAHARRIAYGEEYIWVYGRMSYSDIFRSEKIKGPLPEIRFLRRVIINDGQYFYQPYDHKHYNSST